VHLRENLDSLVTKLHLQNHVEGKTRAKVQDNDTSEPEIVH
jgi:hypothetical protein